MRYKTPEEALEAAKPICAECKHCTVSEWGDYRCERTLNYIADRVSGRTFPHCMECEDEREKSYGDHCGPTGKNFEQKEPEAKKSWLDRIIDFLKVESPLDEDEL